MDLLVVGLQDGSSYHKVYPHSGAAGFCPEIFSLKTCVVRHLGYLLPLASQRFQSRYPEVRHSFHALDLLWVLALILRVLLSFSSSLQRFGGGVQRGMRSLREILRDLVLKIRTTILGGFSLVSEIPHQFFRNLMMEFLWDHLDTVVPFWKWLQSSWRDCFSMVIDVLGSILPYFWSCRSLAKKVLTPFCCRIYSSSAEY